MKTTKKIPFDEIATLKAYVKPGSLINFPSPLSLAQSATEVSDLQYTGSMEVENKNEDDSKNISFGRFNMIKSYPIDDEITYQIGILHAFDLNKPIVKVYSGIQVSACLNLKIFKADNIQKFDFTNNSQGGMESVKNYISKVEEEIENAKRIIKFLKSVILTPQETYTLVGYLVTKVTEEKNICGTNAIQKGVELFTKKDSVYYYKNEGFNAWLLLNSFTEYYTNKTELLDIPEKCLNLYLLISKKLREEKPETLALNSNN